MIPDVPIVGEKTWKSLRFQYAALVGIPEGAPEGTEPAVVGWKIGVFAERSDGLPFGAEYLLDPAKITKDPLATAFELVNKAMLVLESFRACHCVPQHPCLLHAKVSGFKN